MWAEFCQCDYHVMWAESTSVSTVWHGQNLLVCLQCDMGRNLPVCLPCDMGSSLPVCLQCDVGRNLPVCVPCDMGRNLSSHHSYCSSSRNSPAVIESSMYSGWSAHLPVAHTHRYFSERLSFPRMTWVHWERNSWIKHHTQYIVSWLLFIFTYLLTIE